MMPRSVVLTASVVLDGFFYGQWTLPPLRFLYFNIARSLAVFYGTSPWHYYLTQGVPLLLTTAIPFGVLGLWRALRRKLPASAPNADAAARFQAAIAVLFTAIILSFVSHKEVRFLYPLLPLLHLFAGESIADFLQAGLSQPTKHWRWSTLDWFKNGVLFFLLAANIAIGFYASAVHQSGVISVMDYLRHEYESTYLQLPHARQRMTVGFLMPCHSTPWRSHLVHPGIDAWALTCEPPIDVELADRDTYVDEADRFYSDPVAFMQREMRRASPPSDKAEEGGDTSATRHWPDYLVFFEQLEPALNSVLLSGETPNYVECWRHFNTHWHDDGRRRGDVVVWCAR